MRVLYFKCVSEVDFGRVRYFGGGGGKVVWHRRQTICIS